MSNIERDHDDGRADAGTQMAIWGWNRMGRANDSETSGPLVPARVVRHVHHVYDLVCAPEASLMQARVSGAFEFRAAGPADYPTAGDWVLVEPDTGRIQQLLPRRTSISRNVAGDETREQVVAANVDVVLLVFAVDGQRGFTVGLLERSLTVAWNSGARPVVVLNKADLADAAARERALREAEAAAPGVAIYLISARSGEGVEAVVDGIAADETVGMLGKSGVGKTALLNAIARLRGGEVAAREGELRAGDLQGRHTTTDKQLYLLPGGPIIADVPGLRELQLWGDDSGLDATFPDVEELAAECRFTDCTHEGEPGCRIQEALAGGELSEERYQRYRELQGELAYLERKRDARAMKDEQLKWKRIAQFAREVKKRKR